MQCPTCQAQLPDQANFCSNCGARLSEAVAPVQQASAQQGSAAATAGSIAIAGSHNVVNELPAEVLELFARQFGFDLHADDATALKMYFDNVVFERHSKLSFLFIRPETGKVYTEADIEAVFVPLRMTDPDALERQSKLAHRMERFERLPRELEEAARPVTLQKILRKYPVFLLRGKPGCGKTTLLRHIALAFARGEHPEKLGWQGAAPLPLMVSLRNFGTFLKSRAGVYIDPQPRALLDYMEDHLRGAGVRFSPDFIPGRLQRGECFLLLDALDEASGTLEGGGDLRAAVARQVSAFIRRYAPRGNRFALTSRPHAYSDEGDLRRALPEPKVCDVFPLDADGYRRLITNLLGVLAGDLATGRAEADDLYTRIAPNPHLADLAGNPLMCTTLVLVFKYRGRKLPERRVDVLHEIVTLLLGRWEEEKRELSSPDDLARLATPAASTEQAIQFRRRALMSVAWKMQQDHTPELPAQATVQTLTQFYCDEERTDLKSAEKWARGFLDVAHERSGLLIAVDEGLHAFAHQAFREYLAATRLVNEGEVALMREILQHAPRPDDWWEQVVLLAGAHPELSSGAAGRLVETLSGKAEQSFEYAYLAARFAQDMTDKLPGAQRKTLQDKVIQAMQDSARKPPERALAGRALALAGDPRPGVGISPHGDANLPDIAWADLPAGTLMMGSGKGETFQTPGGKQAPWDDELWPEGKPRAISIRAFKMSAYPVTVAQFRPFVQDPQGWQSDEWWTAAGREDRGEHKAPHVWDDPQWNIHNHPVVGVTWYAAVAYCRWLTARLREAGLIPANAVVRLPSEAEWEWSARGPEGCRWPWGNEWRADACNSDESEIGRTSAVGMFPAGVNWTRNVCDLAGNVWEWCSTRWQERYDGDYPALVGVNEWEDNYLTGGARRVIRGGSFGSDAQIMRGAYRGWGRPGFWHSLLGFRCVLWL